MSRKISAPQIPGSRSRQIIDPFIHVFFERNQKSGKSENANFNILYLVAKSCNNQCNYTKCYSFSNANAGDVFGIESVFSLATYWASGGPYRAR